MIQLPRGKYLNALQTPAQKRAAGCDGKACFESWRSAAAVIKRKRRAAHNTGGLEPYHCKYCQSWHIAESLERENVHR